MPLAKLLNQRPVLWLRQSPSCHDAHAACVRLLPQHPDLLMPRGIPATLFKAPHKLYDALKESDAGIAGEPNDTPEHAPYFTSWPSN